MKKFSIVFIIFSLIMACDPCVDCNEPVTFEPTVKMIFINADSVSSLDILITNNSEVSSSLSSSISHLTDTINFLETDSIPSVQERIDAGEDLSELLAILQTAVATFKEERTTITENKSEVDSTITAHNGIKTTINSGLLLVSEITIPETGAFLPYTDSSTSWNIPLSFEKAFTIYDLKIANDNYTIELDYETFTEVDAKRNVLIRAKDIKVISHSFDSLNACEENCVDGNATFTFYF